MGSAQKDFFDDDKSREVAGSADASERALAPDDTGDFAGEAIVSGEVIPNTTRVLASSIQIDPEFHERKAFSEEDLERAKKIARNPEHICSIPVLARDNRLLAVDCSIVLAAILALNPEAWVYIHFVSEKEALAIRFRNQRKSFAREPMAAPRLALAQSRKGMSQEDIADALGMKASNISQMVTAAEVEEYLEDLANLFEERSGLSRAFWYAVHTTRQRLAKADAQIDDGSTPNISRFDQTVAELVAAGEPLSEEMVREKLGINGQRKAIKRRNRRIGEPVKSKRLSIELYADAQRQGGPVINFPPGFPKGKFKAALEVVIAHLIETDGGRADGKES